MDIDPETGIIRGPEADDLAMKMAQVDEDYSQLEELIKRHGATEIMVWARLIDEADTEVAEK